MEVLKAVEEGSSLTWPDTSYVPTLQPSPRTAATSPTSTDPSLAPGTTSPSPHWSDINIEALTSRWVGADPRKPYLFASGWWSLVVAASSSAVHSSEAYTSSTTLLGKGSF